MLRQIHISTVGRLLLLALIFISSTAFKQKQIVVAQDGSGDFKTIQEAVNSLPAESNEQRIIFIRKGVYNEKIFLEKNYITLKGEDKEATKIITSEARDIFRCTHTDDWGVATINIKGNDIDLEDLSFINEYGFTAKEDITVPCAGDSVTKEKKVKKDGHQMVLRSFNNTRLIVKNCVFRSLGGDPVSPWSVEEGMFYFKDCIIEGGVDLYCPRGWSLADNCQFICHSKEAAIWHDGSKNQQSKTVFFNCKFSGDDGFKLGRYHRDAQFYLLDCKFAKNMADADIYQKAANPPNVIQWGKRVYYYNCHKDGGDYEWHKDNLPAPLGINDITIAWVYDYKWKPVKDKSVIEADTIKSVGAVTHSYDTVAENMLLYQRSNGGWPKHFNKEKVDYKHILSSAELTELHKGYDESIDATIDNNATTREIKYLVKVYKSTNDKRFMNAAEKGIDYLLKAQYRNGGWPQYYPDFSSYRSEVTYNDNAMINVLNILTDIVEGSDGFEAIDHKFFNRCSLAVKRGISCILNTQVKQHGKLTVWCAQYNARTLLPAKARAYELPSLSGQESVGILRYLMRIRQPGKKIIAAVNGGMQWFEKVKITGFKFKEIKDEKLPTGKDRVLVPEPGNVIWARFYTLDTNEPFFCGRDGVKKKNVKDIEIERRAGYMWYSETAAPLIKEEYPEWKRRVTSVNFSAIQQKAEKAQ